LKQIFEITDQNIINEVLNNAEYGTLAICDNNKPYSLPINFVKINENIYFHGSKKVEKLIFKKIINLLHFQ
jgi:nitroimidazol reductase NimA-like FMN-containing flavoprotein (pyridoxamine 5'-phosphate oxidase superfamily)